MTSSSELASSLNSKWTLTSDDRLVGARCLGTDVNDGSARRTSEQAKLLQKAARVTAKVLRLREAGAQ
eukprot:6020820-Pyramimonas_sp.AAC.1